MKIQYFFEVLFEIIVQIVYTEQRFTGGNEDAEN